MLEPLLPPPGNTTGRGARPEKHPRRRVLDAIFYLARGGIAWAALPHEFPPHQTVYGLFGRWARHGAWQHIHDALRDRVRVHEGRNPQPTAAVIDSQSVRGATPSPVGPAAMTPERRSTAANATSPWTPADCCSRSWSPSPGSKTATPPTAC